MCVHGYNRWHAAQYSVRRTGAPIQVPVGPNILGRIFNVLGKPVDNKGPVEAEAYYPIHRPAPTFEEQSTRVEVFETGLKVIDLIAPFTKGGKTGIFGGAGVGKTVIIMELIRSIATVHQGNSVLPVWVNVPVKERSCTVKCSNRAL